MDSSIYCGVYGIVIKNRKVLLVRNDDDLFDLPGGLLEYNKKPLDILKTFFVKQVGVGIRNAKLIDVSSNVDKSKNKYNVGIIYDVKINPGDLKCEWMCIDELSKDIITPFVYETLILKGFVVK